MKRTRRHSNAARTIRASATKPNAHAPIEFTVPVTIAAAAAAAEGEKKGPRRFEMNAYTGGPMRLRGWSYPVVVDLKGMSGINKSRPILLNHDETQIVGHSDAITVDNGKVLKAAGLMSGAGACAAEVMAAADNGFPWQASIGAKPVNVEFVPAGSTAKVNGSSFDGPINVARKTVLGEISFVPLGADDDTSARIAAGAAGESTMNFEQWLEAKGFKLADLNDQQKKSLQAAFDAEIKATTDAGEGEGEGAGEGNGGKKNKGRATRKGKKAIAAAARTTVDDDGEGEVDDDDQTIDAAGDVLKDMRATAAGETKRLAAVKKICNGQHAEIEAKAIGEGWTVEKTELEVLRASRPKGGPYINTGAGQDVTEKAIVAAASLSAGIGEKVAFAGCDDKTKEIAASRKLRGVGLHQVMFLIAAANGISFTPGRVDDEFLRAMLHHDQQQMIRAADGAGFSTMSLSGITENILNKAMLEAYGSVDSVVGEFCYETDTNDFKQFKRYRLTGSGAFSEVGPTGELKNMSLQDESYANQVKTTGAIIQITRNILVNDDMGALVQVPQLIGRQAAIAREKAAFTILVTNTGSFFSTTNKNYATGAGSALQISSLATARQKFVEQKDANGDPIMVMPDRILVPPALETVADNLFQGANIVVGALGSTAAKSVEPNLNAHRNKYRPIVSPFLGVNSPIATNASDTRWYLGTGPAGGMAPVQIGYLRGQRTPIIERGEANFNTLGIAMRGYYDFGVAQHDNRTMVMNDGA